MKRWIRACRAHEYLDMGRTLFERRIRPQLHPIRFDKKGVFFARLELDAVARTLEHAAGVPEENLWDEKGSTPDFGTEAAPGGLRKPSGSPTRPPSYGKVRDRLVLK